LPGCEPPSVGGLAPCAEGAVGWVVVVLPGAGVVLVAPPLVLPVTLGWPAVGPAPEPGLPEPCCARAAPLMPIRAAAVKASIELRMNILLDLSRPGRGSVSAG
ncbi:hypothetical protein HMPREF0731_4277, partial [Pseudoroseomonas cervicalis ATCC 49957]